MNGDIFNIKVCILGKALIACISEKMLVYYKIKINTYFLYFIIKFVDIFNYLCNYIKKLKHALFFNFLF